MTLTDPEEFKQVLIGALTDHQNNRFQKALEGYERVLATNPDLPEIVNHAAMARFELGDVDAAIAGLRRAVALNPNYADAHTNLGNVLSDGQRDDEALEAYKAAIMARAESPDAYRGRGEIFLKRGNLDKAEEALVRAVHFNPNYLDAFKLLGMVLGKKKDHDGARRAFDSALALSPEDADCLINLGNLALVVGDLESARHHYARALKVDPTLTGPRFTLARLGDNDSHLAALLDMAEHEVEEGRDDFRTRFALAAALDKSGRFDEAFVEYAEANRLKRQELDYDPNRHSVLMDDIAAVFDRTFFAKAQREGDGTRVPIFIVGMPRSGTTLTEQILSSHSQVKPLGELNLFGKLALGVRQMGREDEKFPHAVATFIPDVFTEIARRYLDMSGGGQASERCFTDKMPDNFKYVGLIHRVFPNAKIIHCRRGALDTCLSCFTQNFAEGQFFAYNLGELGLYYRDYARLMAHWEAVLPGRMLTVQYEDTVADLEKQARYLLDYCGLPWEDRVLDFHKTDRPVWTASAGQVHKPIYHTSVGRWRRFQKHLGPLVEALGASGDLIPKD